MQSDIEGLYPMGILILYIIILSLRILHLKNENLTLSINLLWFGLVVHNTWYAPSSLSVFWL